MMPQFTVRMSLEFTAPTITGAEQVAGELAKTAEAIGKSAGVTKLRLVQQTLTQHDPDKAVPEKRGKRDY
jgi:hypothetical protein